MEGKTFILVHNSKVHDITAEKTRWGLEAPSHIHNQEQRIIACIYTSAHLDTCHSVQKTGPEMMKRKSWTGKKSRKSDAWIYQNNKWLSRKNKFKTQKWNIIFSRNYILFGNTHWGLEWTAKCPYSVCLSISIYAMKKIPPRHTLRTTQWTISHWAFLFRLFYFVSNWQSIQRIIDLVKSHDMAWIPMWRQYRDR